MLYERHHCEMSALMYKFFTKTLSVMIHGLEVIKNSFSFILQVDMRRLDMTCPHIYSKSFQGGCVCVSNGVAAALFNSLCCLHHFLKLLPFGGFKIPPRGFRFTPYPFGGFKIPPRGFGFAPSNAFLIDLLDCAACWLNSLIRQKFFSNFFYHIFR